MNANVITDEEIIKVFENWYDWGFWMRCFKDDQSLEDISKRKKDYFLKLLNEVRIKGK